MTIEQLKSGAYRIKMMCDGVTYRVTVPYKPSKKEALALIQDKISQSEVVAKGTFADYARRYVDIQSNLLSPSTIRSYLGILNNLSADFTTKQLSKITQADVTEEMNTYSVSRSPKSVRNAHAFISAVMKMYRPNFVLTTKLPQKVKYDKYVPTREEVQRILDHVKGTRYYIPYRLACYGLRRGEICAIEGTDISDANILSIKRVKCQDEGNTWVIKPYPKNYSSMRDIYIDDELASMIREQGFAYDGHPNRLSDNLNEVQKQLGITRFRFHDFRAYFATELSQANFSEADIMAMGGWASDYTMKNVYRQARINKEQDIQRRASALLVPKS